MYAESNGWFVKIYAENPNGDIASLRRLASLLQATGVSFCSVGIIRPNYKSEEEYEKDLEGVFRFICLDGTEDEVKILLKKISFSFEDIHFNQVKSDYDGWGLNKFHKFSTPVGF